MTANTINQKVINFGTNLKRIREELKISKFQFAIKYLEIDVKQLTKIENGEVNCNYETLCKIINTLNEFQVCITLESMLS